MRDIINAAIRYYVVVVFSQRIINQMTQRNVIEEAKFMVPLKNSFA